MFRIDREYYVFHFVSAPATFYRFILLSYLFIFFLHLFSIRFCGNRKSKKHQTYPLKINKEMSWEDDDFEVPTLNVAAIAQSNDDEEDLLLVEKREALKRLASGEIIFIHSFIGRDYLCGHHE